MRNPREIPFEIVAWNPDDHLELAVDWMFQVHADDIERAQMNGEARAAAIHEITMFEDNPSCSLYGILVDGKPGGIAGVMHQNAFERSAELMLFLAPEHANRGIGRLIVEQMHELLDAAGFLKLRMFPLSQLSKNGARRLGYVEKKIELTMMVRGNA